MVLDPTDDLQEYSNKIRSRIDFLEKTFMNSIGKLSALNSEVESFSSITKKELLSMKKDLDDLNKQLSAIVKNILKLINAFKNSLDIAKFKAFSQRVDAFKGESFITREEFKKWLKEDLS